MSAFCGVAVVSTFLFSTGGVTGVVVGVEEGVEEGVDVGVDVGVVVGVVTTVLLGWRRVPRFLGGVVDDGVLDLGGGGASVWLDGFLEGLGLGLRGLRGDRGGG